MIRSVKYHACESNPRARANPCDTQNALTARIPKLYLNQQAMGLLPVTFAVFLIVRLF
jgi:hypothetical protein